MVGAPERIGGGAAVRRIGYATGAGLLLLAAAALVAQLLSLLAQGAYRPVALDSIWRQVHAGSLAGLQTFVEQRVSPGAWTPLQWLLGLPAWLVLGLVGGLLLLGGRGERRRGYD